MYTTVTYLVNSFTCGNIPVEYRIDLGSHHPSKKSYLSEELLIITEHILLFIFYAPNNTKGRIFYLRTDIDNIGPTIT